MNDVVVLPHPQLLVNHLSLLQFLRPTFVIPSKTSHVLRGKLIHVIPVVRNTWHPGYCMVFEV